MAPHEFHQSDSTRHAARLGVRAIEHARRFLDRAIETERARDEADVVVDGFRHANDRKSVAAPARFLIESLAPRWVPSPPTVKRMFTPRAMRLSTALPTSTGPREVPRIVPPF
jgi:hypothetical protein